MATSAVLRATGIAGALLMLVLALAIAASRRPGSSEQPRASTVDIEVAAPAVRSVATAPSLGAAPRSEPEQSDRFARDVERLLAVKIRAELDGNVKHVEYLQCLSSGTTEHYCPSLYADAVNLAMSEAGTLASAEALRVELDRLPPFDRAKARSAVAKVAESSSDDLARIAALTVLSFETEGEHPPLSSTTYAGLLSKPVVESMLLARRHAATPILDARIADDFASLAESPDPRLRTSSIRALGHEATAEQLNRALGAVTLEGAQALGAARAMMKCGSGCLPSIERMMEGDARSRLAVYEALTFAPPESREAIADAIRAHPPRDEGERAERAELSLNADVRL